jgi:hypothetical protein
MAKISYKQIMLNKLLGEFQPIVKCNCNGYDLDHADNCPIKKRALE